MIWNKFHKKLQRGYCPSRGSGPKSVPFSDPKNWTTFCCVFPFALCCFVGSCGKVFLSNAPFPYMYLRVTYGVFSSNLLLSTAYFLSTFGCLALIFFQLLAVWEPWAVYGWVYSDLRLFATDFLSTLGCLQQNFCQPKVLCGWFSFNPALSTVVFLWILCCLRRFFY